MKNNTQFSCYSIFIYSVDSTRQKVFTNSDMYQNYYYILYL